VEISFKTKEHPEARKFEYDMPTDLAGLNAKFGEDAVAKAASGAFVISLQALARRNIEKTDAEIQELAKTWNPNERAAAVKQSPLERATNAFSKLSPEEKAELIKQLKAKQG
jgi:hypothetical protein